MVAALAIGDEVVTGGGILGKVTETGDQFLTVEIADGVRVKVQRHTVASVLPKGTYQERLSPRGTPACTTYPAWNDSGWSPSSCCWRPLLGAAERVRRGAGAAAVAQRPRGLHRAGQAGRHRHPGGQGHVPSTPRYLEGDRLRAALRRPSTQQLAARDAIQHGAPREYLIALSQAPRMPGWMRALGLKPMSLGLDLRGGVHFLYEVDVVGAVKQLLAQHGARLPHAAPRRADPVHAASQASAPMPCDDLAAHAATMSTAPRQRCASRTRHHCSRPAPLGEGGVVRVRLTPAQIKERQDFAIQQNITTLRNRVDELGVTEPIVARQGVDRIVVQLPGVQDPNEAAARARRDRHARIPAGRTTRTTPLEAERPAGRRSARRLFQRREGGPVLLKRDIIVSGDQLVDASSGFSEGQPAVFVKLDARGAAEMLDTTQANLGRPMAVVFIETEARQTMRAVQRRPTDRVHRGGGHQRRDDPAACSAATSRSPGWSPGGARPGPAAPGRRRSRRRSTWSSSGPSARASARTTSTAASRRCSSASSACSFGRLLPALRPRRQRRAVLEHGAADGPAVPAAGGACRCPASRASC